MHLRSKNKTRDFNARAMSVRAPSTVDAEARTLRAVMTTEAPVLVFDFERWDMVPEILLMSGMQAPEIGQVPFLDSHDRSSVESLLGSARDFQPVDVNGVAGMDALVSFASTEDALKAFTKMREGHLTDVSVGYQPIERVWIKDGEKGVVAGRTYDGPCYVVTRWSLRELSATPIGADSNAKSRASQNKPDPKERSMSKHLRKLLLARGMASTATDEQADLFYRALSDELQAELKAQAEKLEQEERAAANQPAGGAGGATVTPAPQPQGGGEPSSRAAEIEAATRAERERIQGIRDVGRTSGMPDADVEALIASNASLDQARKAALDQMAQRNPVLGGHVEVGRSDSEKFRAAAVDGLAFGMNVRHADESRYAPGYDAFRGMTLQMLVRECLERQGVRTHRLSGDQLASRAFGAASTSDFPAILANVANKVMRKIYTEAPATWRPFCNVVSAKDFKSMDRPQLSGFSDLELVGENGEYKMGKFSDSKESYAVKSYGKLFFLSRQVIINDDMGAFMRLPRAFASAAARRISDLVYSILTSNPTMGADSVALFHSSHGNLAGSGGSIAQATLSAGRAAMLKQTDPSGAKMNLEARFLLVSPDNQTDAEVILRSVSQVQDNRSSGVVNPFYNALTPIVESRLDTGSPDPWYLVGDPSQIDTIEVAFLDGNETPFIDESVQFNTDGVQYKVRLDAGVAPLDHRGFYKNPGA
jgi:hypothetical protein